MALHGVYDNVIFDFCDVLLDWQPRAAVEGVCAPDVLDRLFDYDDPYGFWHYDELSDLGWSEERILADYAAHHAVSDSALTSTPEVQAFRTYFERQRLALVGMIPGMDALLQELNAAGVQCWGLTNFTVKYVDAARELFAPLGVLRDVVVSSAERIHKPDPEIYRRAVSRFDIDPSHAAFVDDKQRNADAAAAAVPGLTGIQFTGASALRSALLRED
ncbi:hydrolase [Bifidobacterium goeldii]|uniref:Hydrolase n=1 Tax=Bifidobacterium goeldii TaxID=2306975 RepID=A0A430FKT1_9BIFI|nr:HAD-IA family hydrolase [Bifidobacterium goeldii]RSX53515.1 hydrolase [Bifidobacterium goeldii]